MGHRVQEGRRDVKYASKFALGSFVYTRTGSDRESPWIIVSVGFRLGGSIVYSCSHGATTTDFFEDELKDSPCYSLRPGSP